MSTSSAPSLLTVVPLALDDLRDLAANAACGETSRAASRAATSRRAARRRSLGVAQPSRHCPEAAVSIPLPAKPRRRVPEKSRPLNGVHRHTPEQRFQKEIEFARAVKNQRFPPWPTLPVLPPMTWAASSESDRFDFTAWPPVAPCLVEL
jgi:hypothetical protein